MAERVEFPSGPFTNAEMRNAGISPKRLEGAVAARRVRRILRGVYVAVGEPDSIEQRIGALAKVVAPGHILCDRSAAWLHGVDVHAFGEHESLPPVETCVLPDRWATRLAGVRGHSRDLSAADVIEVGGVLVTSPLRTALDVACNLRRREALAALDSFGRLHGISRDDLLRQLPRFRGRRGVVQARALVRVMDASSESSRESWLRLALIDEGLPTPQAQYWVEISDGIAFRLDLAYPAHRIAIEYDGAEFHSSPDLRARDDERRWLLREAGWTVIVVRNGDFTGDRQLRWLHEVKETLRRRYSTLRW